MSHKFKLKYEVKSTPGEFTRKELETDPNDVGGTDALVVFSILYPDDGSYSAIHLSIDGRNEGKPLDSHELWKLWILFGTNLAKKEDLSSEKREIAGMPAKVFFEKR